MIRDITIGQYYSVKSPIHALDPRVKLVATILYVVSLFCFQSFSGYVAAILFLGVMIHLSNVPFSYMVRGLKPIAVILGITVFFNLFFSSSGQILWSWGSIVLSTGGIRKALFMAFRLVLLILGSSLMTLTTTPNQLTDGMERLLAPLKKIKVPVHEIAMMMSIALRFIPILLEETDKIMKAQMARGADFETGNIIKRAKCMIPIIVPLFIAAFRRANDLAMAMEARCYRGDEGRTKMKPLAYTKKDRISYAVVWGYFACVIVIGNFLYF